MANPSTSQVIPDTNDLNISVLAVAWEIVKITYVGSVNNGSELDAAEITNAVIKVRTALEKREPIK